MIALESRPRQRAQIIAQRASGALILLSLADGNYYRLNEVGDRVWELCDGTRSVAEVVAIIGQEYEAPAEAVEADVLALLEELAHEKLVEDRT
jgi:coenzyme PQQ biosynthesis protein PqqD